MTHASSSPTLDARLRDVCATIFNVDAHTLGDDASPQTVPEWDSLSHLSLVLALEEEFGVTFDADEIPALNSFARLRERLAAA